MSTFEAVLKEICPSYTAAELYRPWMGDTGCLCLVGTCGGPGDDEGSAATREAQRKLFAVEGGGVVLGVTSGVPVVGDIRPQVCTFYVAKNEHEAQRSTVRDTERWWYFAKLSQALPDLKEKLRWNPNFPSAEVDLLPRPEVLPRVEADGTNALTSATSALKQITCDIHSLTGVAEYCSAVPAAERTLERVVLNAATDEPGDLLRQKIVENLLAAFPGPDTVAHTLVINGASTELISAIVTANLPGLARLVLNQTSCFNVKFTTLLPHFAANSHLEELSFDTGVSSADVEYLYEHCSHISIRRAVISVAPPRAATRTSLRGVSQALCVGGMLEVCHRTHDDDEHVIRLETGTTVPMHRHVIPRFLLLKNMLANPEQEKVAAEEEGDKEKVNVPAPVNSVPIDMDPPVGKEALALAVHFATYYVSDAMHDQCEAEESNRRDDEDDAAAIQMPTKRRNLTYTWCRAFQEFRTVHIQQRYPTHMRRFHIMCELMAVAAYLNCPSLKRFIRAALMMDEMEEHETVKDKEQEEKRSRSE